MTKAHRRESDQRVETAGIVELVERDGAAEPKPEAFWQQRQKKIDLCLVVILVGFGLCSLIAYVNQYLGLYYPYDTFLFRPEDRFGDFIRQFEVSRDLYVAKSPQQMPFCYLILRLFRLLPRRIAVLSFLGVFVASVAAVMAYWTRLPSKVATARNVLTFVLCSYPVLITVDRANMEALIFIGVALTLLLFYHEHWWAGVLVLAVAIAIKPFVAVFLLLPIVRRKYLQALCGLVLGAALMLGPLFFFPGGVVRNFENFSADMAAYHELYEVGIHGLYFNHSLFGLVKSYIVSQMVGLDSFDEKSAHALLYYRPVAPALGCLVMWRLFRMRLPLWKQAALVTCCMNLLPLTSGDYRLLHFLPIFGLFVSHHDAEIGRGTSFGTSLGTSRRAPLAGLGTYNTAYALLFGFLLAPKNIYHFIGSEITSAAATTPLAMILLCALIMLEPQRQQNKEPAEART